jgi:hypothetical protein
LRLTDASSAPTQILDEGHKIKSETTLVSQGIRAISRQVRRRGRAGCLGRASWPPSHVPRHRRAGRAPNIHRRPARPRPCCAPPPPARPGHAAADGHAAAEQPAGALRPPVGALPRRVHHARPLRRGLRPGARQGAAARGAARRGACVLPRALGRPCLVRGGRYQPVFSIRLTVVAACPRVPPPPRSTTPSWRRRTTCCAPSACAGEPPPPPGTRGGFGAAPPGLGAGGARDRERASRSASRTLLTPLPTLAPPHTLPPQAEGRGREEPAPQDGDQHRMPPVGVPDLLVPEVSGGWGAGFGGLKVCSRAGSAWPLHPAVAPGATGTPSTTPRPNPCPPVCQAACARRPGAGSDGERCQVGRRPRSRARRRGQRVAAADEPGHAAAQGGCACMFFGGGGRLRSCGSRRAGALALQLKVPVGR